ncbi:type II/IV secretion system protein, partial [Candidatus Saccharibacteria bacterium]|nr:type II/IV secretion system protein [Candidatus Saccharibacteria bacterium]
MRIPDSMIVDLLVDSGKLEDGAVEEFKAEGQKDKISLQSLALKKQILSEKDLTKLYATETNTPYVELAGRKIKKETLNKIPERIARKYRVILYDYENQIPRLAMEDPDDLQAIDFLQKQLGM